MILQMLVKSKNQFLTAEERLRSLGASLQEDGIGDLSMRKNEKEESSYEAHVRADLVEMVTAAINS